MVITGYFLTGILVFLLGYLIGYASADRFWLEALKYGISYLTPNEADAVYRILDRVRKRW